MNARYTKLRDGRWGARVPGKAAAGDQIAITTKAGKTQQRVVKAVLWSGHIDKIDDDEPLLLPCFHTLDDYGNNDGGIVSLCSLKKGVVMTPSTPASKKFPARLKAARELRKLSQTQLAEKTGFQPSAISHFESDRRSPSIDNFKRLADALNITTEYLLGRTDDPYTHTWCGGRDRYDWEIWDE